MLVVDVETTGPDLKLEGPDFPGFSILSIGAVYFGDPSFTFYEECRQQNGTKITESSLKVAQFTKKQIQDTDKPTVDIVVKNFLDWAEQFQDKTFAGMNSFFDWGPIDDVVRKFLPDYFINVRTVELHTVCYQKYLELGLEVPLDRGFSRLNLKRIMEFVGIENLDIPHHALEDAKIETECFYRLWYGINKIDTFSKYPVPEVLKK